MSDFIEHIRLGSSRNEGPLYDSQSHSIRYRDSHDTSSRFRSPNLKPRGMYRDGGWVGREWKIYLCVGSTYRMTSVIFLQITVRGGGWMKILYARRIVKSS